MISSLQKTMLVRYWHPARVHYMHCEFSVTTDCQIAHSKTFSHYDSRNDTLLHVPRRGRASARQVIVQDWMHSYDVWNMATLLMFRRRLLISLLQLTSHCSSEFSTTNFTCCSRRCLTRLSIVKPPLATATAASCIGPVHLFVCMFVCSSVCLSPNCKNADFLEN